MLVECRDRMHESDSRQVDPRESADREHGLQLRTWKKAVRSAATAAGSSAGAKWPPRGKTVQRWMLYKRSGYERGSSPSGTVWCAKTPNARSEEHTSELQSL